MPDIGNLDARIARLEYKFSNHGSRLAEIEQKLSSQLQSLGDVKQSVGDVRQSVNELREDHDLLIEMNAKMDAMDNMLKTYVTKNEFSPVRLISFGLVAVSLTAVLLSVIISALKNKAIAP